MPQILLLEDDAALSSGIALALKAAGRVVPCADQGIGCHGSTPEKGVDPVNIAAHIIINLQEIIAREIPEENTSASKTSVMRLS